MKSRTLRNLLLTICLSAFTATHGYTMTGGSEPTGVKKTTTKKTVAKKYSATHPFYRTALSDLRTARWMIYHHPANWQPTVSEGEAIAHIDAAISVIVKASIDDGRGPNDRPKGAGKSSPARLTSALRYLRKARVNISRDGDKNLAQGLQLRAYEQIDGAIGAVKKTVRS
jgi:hypothetical protein